ncbi:MAG: carbamoyl-phosphate synthase large subunit, partial [Deltaproteobacteria bacterium]
MNLRRLLIANRGEVAIRIARTARELGLATVGVHGEDEPDAPHLALVDAVEALEGEGPKALLDPDALVAAALKSDCDALHPGYGLLSESPALARACQDAGISFVGPPAETLELFGDKTRAKALARSLEIPVLAGPTEPCSLEEAERFRATLGHAQGESAAAVLLKAVSGGGGRGMRRVDLHEDLAAAYGAASREAELAFGTSELYVEAFVTRARHIEVQLVGDGRAVMSLGDRECTLQRQHQKLIELAPAPNLPQETREALHSAALALGRASRLQGLATVEFLIDADDGSRFFFLEVNPRLQVEHTVTEEVTGVDCVALQLGLAEGLELEALGLEADERRMGQGAAAQLRIHHERMQADGRALPSASPVRLVHWPGGPGIRIDSALLPGRAPNIRFDSLCAKLIVRGAHFDDVIRRARRALDEFVVEGPDTNAAFLAALLDRPEVKAARLTTRFVENEAADLLDAASQIERGWRRPVAQPSSAASTGLAGAQINDQDPLAVLDYGRTAKDVRPATTHTAASSPVSSPTALASSIDDGPPGTLGLPAPLQGTILSFEVELGDPVAVGQPIALVEAMKMEHVVTASISGIVRAFAAQPGDPVIEGHPIAFIEPGEVAAATAARNEEPVDLNFVRDDLQAVLDRHTTGLDRARGDAVTRRHSRGHRTARENLADLVDPDSFVEYGAVVVAAQRRRRALDDLIANTPADGMLAGIGRVNGALFPGHAGQAVVVSYDYMVLAGTQGAQNHRKKDRLFDLAQRQRLPVVLFAEGGGGRPGDTDGIGGSGLDCLAFALFAGLSGLVPTVGIANGRCFAGNAALLGCCDVVIACEGSNIGMGGPAMVEGGGLGVFHPEEIGPMNVQVANGVVDLAVADEAEAVAVAKQYLSYFQGPTP